MSSEKQLLRRQMKEARDAITEDACEAFSHMICKQLLFNPLLRAAKKICCYAPIKNEVDIWPLIKRLLSTGDKQLAFPRVDRLKKGQMEFYEVKELSELTEGSFGVREPVDEKKEPIDWPDAVLLVPGVAFSAAGARIGYGGGYYDRYLAEHANMLRIGVAFDLQLNATLDELCEPTDIRMDYVQTQYRCYAAVDSYDYEKMVNMICNSRRFGKKPGVESAREIMALLDNPQDELSFVHIAGTNGKGSVAAFLTEIGTCAGLRVGCFTSPHLERFTERIRIGQKEIAAEDVLCLGKKVWHAGKRLLAEKGIALSMFDYCFAIAMLYFAGEQVDVVVLETGLGGRLDATNIIKAPLVSVITEIGLEHTQYLGDTIACIASEKAGILKTKTHAVVMEQSLEALGVLQERCRAQKVPMHISTSVDADGLYDGIHYTIGLYGTYQRRNAAAAIEAAKLLSETFSQINAQSIKEGIRLARWPGRMELLSKRPMVLLDGAHNVDGVRALRESLLDMWPNKKFVFFMGVMAEKDYDMMLSTVLPLAKRIYTLSVHSDRALSSDALCAYIRDRHMQAESCSDMQSFLLKLAECGEEEVCVVFGSLYLIGEVRASLNQIEVMEGMKQ